MKIFFFRLVGVCCLWSLACGLSGCIRLSGSAGYYKQRTEDEAPVVKQVGFDTQQMIPNQQKGSIQMGENS